MDRIAYAHRRILESGNTGRSVAYFANMGREIAPGAAAGPSPASDVLASVAGASIIGSNREPRRPPPPACSAQAAAGRKARLLDRDSYYYVWTRDPRYADKRQNAARNAALLDAEFSAQAETFMRNGSILPAMRKKDMLARYRGGAVLRALAKGHADKLEDYL